MIVQVDPTLFIICFTLGKQSPPKQIGIQYNQMYNCIRLCSLGHPIPTCSVTHPFTPMKMAIKCKRTHYM